MIYDPWSIYTVAYLKTLPPLELRELFKEAKLASHSIATSKLIRKVIKDISRMRLLLNGFDSTYNGEHNDQ